MAFSRFIYRHSRNSRRRKAKIKENVGVTLPGRKGREKELETHRKGYLDNKFLSYSKSYQKTCSKLPNLCLRNFFDDAFRTLPPPPPSLSFPHLLRTAPFSRWHGLMVVIASKMGFCFRFLVPFGLTRFAFGSPHLSPGSANGTAREGGGEKRKKRRRRRRDVKKPLTAPGKDNQGKMPEIAERNTLISAERNAGRNHSMTRKK